MQNCAQCHGDSGKGDGPGRESMNPKTPPPANFTDAEFMAGLSPFKVYNTTTFGIDNTAMASFAALPDEQRWQVAFYVMALRFSADSGKRGRSLAERQVVPGDLAGVAKLGDFVRRRAIRQNQKEFSRRAGRRRSSPTSARASGKEIRRSIADRPHSGGRSRGDLQSRR